MPALGQRAELLELDDQLDANLAKELAVQKELEKELAKQIGALEGLEKELANAEPVVDETVNAKEDDGSSLSWLLGSKYRFLLTSERPNKKRKLLGADAGLDLLLRLPYSTSPDPCCHYCFLGPSSSESDPFLQCDTCKVWVHRKCYGVLDVPTGPWLCSWCKHMEVSEKSPENDSWLCELCPKNGGALKSVGEDTGGPAKFVHLFCSMWRPEVYVEDTGAMEPILNVGGVHDMHMKLTCYLCKTKHGACVRCSYGTCRSPFHPICARESKLQMEIWGKFGCDNIELRAFCSKHSNSRPINSSKHSVNFNVNVTSISSAAKPPPVLPSNKLPKLRLSRGIIDTSRPQDEVRTTTKIVRSDDTLEHNPLGFRLSVEGEEAKLVKDTDTGVVRSESCITNSVDLVRFLRKLIDRGRVNIDDVASEIGVSCNSLEAALLQGETTSFSPDLKLKIIRWLHDSAHILRCGSAIPLDNEVAKIDDSEAGKVCGPFVLDDTKFADLSAPDAAVVNSLPPCRTKSKFRILKDNEASNRASKIPASLTEDFKEEIIYDKLSNHNLHSCCESLELSEKILEGSNPTGSRPSLDLPPGLKENSMEINCNNLDKAHHQTPITGAVASFGSGNAQADEINVTTSQILEKGGTHDCDVDVPVSSGQPDLIVGKPHAREDYAVSKQNDGGAYCNGDDVKTIRSVATNSVVSASCDHQPLRSFCSEKNLFMDATKDCQLAKARETGVLELSPEDEVEGELLYLQSRLRNKAVAINCSCEYLIFRVIQNLPRELDMLNERRWNLIIVSQFLREVQEAKKQGRKERRHREAQAVATAAAAAAASSRNSSLRKDANDEIISIHQEGPPKVRTASGRDPLPSVCTPKPRSMWTTLSKVSHDKHTWVSHLPDFSQENAVSCDICRQAETVLNQIFVCSCCKVAVHLGCYRSLENPILSWKCELCEEITSLPRSPNNEMVDGRRRHYVDARCVLCDAASGAFRKSTDGQWVHALCAEWLLESNYRRGQTNPVEGLYAILKDKKLQSCCVCKQNVGLCLKCSYGHCQITFHPTCARNAGLYMNVKSIDGRLQHKAYCEKHSSVQREVDNQQHGTEELNTVRQMRVVLEKARILCERIVKREKLKKELVLCSHEILASQRDAAAFSVLVRSSFFPPGVSSDSATTSINNKSYSGTIQRSDDITVDSTASVRPVRFSMHTNVDKRTNDGTSSQQFSKQKFADRTRFSGKHLPHRPASTSLQNRAEGEQWSKEKKHRETFQKELVMTSDQASMQNQRLPKGFAYVPVGRLAKEKTSTDDMESCEPREPGG